MDQTYKPWTRAQAIKLINKIEAGSKKYNITTALGGSVLLKGKSDKDLDIILYPYKTGIIKQQEFFDWICCEFVIFLVAVVDHRDQGDNKLVYICHYFDRKQNKRRIDFIIPNLQIEDRIQEVKVWKTKKKK